VIPEVFVRDQAVGVGAPRPGGDGGYLAILLPKSKRWQLTQEQRARLADALPAKKGRNPQ